MIVEVVCGYKTYDVTSTGSIYTCTHNNCFHIEKGTVLYPNLNPDLSSKGVICVCVKNKVTACVTNVGEVFTLGLGEYFRLGHGNMTDQDTPKRIEALVGVVAKQVACGANHTSVRTEDGQVYTFGIGQNGQLGHGDKENKTVPALVQSLESKHITQVYCGTYHTIALTSLKRICVHMGLYK